MISFDRVALDLTSRLLDYPDEKFFADLPVLKRDINNFLSDNSMQKASMINAVTELSKLGVHNAQEMYVATFDHDPDASLYMAWHRYGNDRGQGKALAALNGLYRTAGLEPEYGSMPDYLPRMLEFMAVADEWATEVILDGFGPEINHVIGHLKEINCIYAAPLDNAITPLRVNWPDKFRPRTTPDPTIRSMAQPEPEYLLANPEILPEDEK